MASSGSKYLEDIDEKFCQCPICLQQYSEPKQLPCLHRYCSDCLQQVVERNQGVTVISCPECRDEVPIPQGGVNGFKTDFYMKNIIEYIQIQKSLGDGMLRECYNCSRKLNVTAYCFKCNGFLCKECHDIHMTGKSLKDHKQHALSLEDLKSNHMTLEKLADLKEAPRCQNHPEDLCRLCCRTCNDLPICVACVHGRHKNHDINDVEIIAAEEREKLQHEIKELDQYRERMLKMPQAVDRVKEDITSNFTKNKEHLTTSYEREKKIVETWIEQIEGDYKLSQTKMENNKEKELMETRKRMDEEMKQMKIKYDNICDEIKEKNRVKIENLRKKQVKEVEKSKEKLAILEREFQVSMNILAKRQEEGFVQLQEISHQIVGIIGRYENLTATGYSVLEIRNDWTAVQCIPDIGKAIYPLREDMKREFPELETSSRTWARPDIREDELSPVNIEGYEKNVWRIDGITGGVDGNIVITGLTSTDYQSHITVINMKGIILRNKKLKGQYQQMPNRYCTYLSEFKVATTCWYDEIGIFDVGDYSYIKKNIRNVISSWPVTRSVICITTDPVNNHILVGGFNSRDVYIFDDQLNYHHTLKLPEMIKYPRDMTISEGNLMVCDRDGKGAYVVSMEGLEGKLTHEFTKPNLDEDYGTPLNVCTDSNGFIYILWMTGSKFSTGKRVVVQYTKDGRQLLTAKQIGCNDARCMATVKTNNTEKLLVASWNCGKIHIYYLT